MARRNGAEYEWIQHVAIARPIGVEDGQISAVENRDLGSKALSPKAQALLEFANQVIESPEVDQQVFASVNQLFPPRQIIETMLVTGNYQMLARVMTVLDVDIDEAIGESVLRQADRRLRSENGAD